MQQTTKQANQCSKQINTTNKSSIIIVCAARGAIQRDECKHKQGLSFVGKTPSFVFFTQNTDNTHYFVFSSKNTDHTQNTDITQNTDNTLQSLESKLQSPYVYCHCLFQSSVFLCLIYPSVSNLLFARHFLSPALFVQLFTREDV